MKFKMVQQDTVFALAQWVGNFQILFHEIFMNLKTIEHAKPLRARHNKA